MAFRSFTQRSLLAVLLSASLTTCSSDGLVPPENVDHRTKVGAIRRAPVYLNEAESRQSYPSPVGPGGNLDTPNLADGRTSAGPPRSRLPKIDSDEAMAGPQGGSAGYAGQPAAWGGAKSLSAPQGVNMDAELGVEPVVGLAQEQQQQIAEGETDEPLVDGIGSQTPVAVKRPRLPQPEAGVQMSRAPVWSDGRPVTAPGRVPEEDEGTEVAMLRPENPLRDAPSSPVLPGAMPASELSCRRELKRMGVDFIDKPPISQGPACQVPYPISLRGLSGNIDVKPAVTLNCQVTLAFAKWVKNELAPAARTRYWSGIAQIEPMGGYSCRRMNNSRQRYNPMSEHAKGNAIDIGRFVLKNGHEIDVRKKGFFAFREKGLLKAVRSDSCRYFNTVLGPGSNPEHWNHFHFDLRERAGGKVFCN